MMECGSLMYSKGSDWKYTSRVSVNMTPSVHSSHWLSWRIATGIAKGGPARTHSPSQRPCTIPSASLKVPGRTQTLTTNSVNADVHPLSEILYGTNQVRRPSIQTRQGRHAHLRTMQIHKRVLCSLKKRSRGACTRGPVVHALRRAVVHAQESQLLVFLRKQT